MKTRKILLAIIFIITVSLTSFAADYNLLVFEPIGLASKVFSGYYSKVSEQNGYTVTFPLRYEEQSDTKLLNAGIKYRNYLTARTKGFYVETNGSFELYDTSGPDTVTLTPTFVVGYKIDSGQGIFIEPEALFSLPFVSTSGSGLTASERVETQFRVIIGLDNIWPNGIFFAPRVIFSYNEDTLDAKGKLFIGYGF